MPQMFVGSLFELALLASRGLGGDGGLEAGVEHLIGVELGAVAGQVKQLNAVVMLLRQVVRQSLKWPV